MNQIVNNTGKIKQINVEVVKETLIKLNYGTKLTISNETGLSIATCGNILNELLRRGEVIKIGMERPNGGRPARCFKYNANYCYVACIYLEYKEEIYKINYVVSNLIGKIIEEGSVILDTVNYGSIVGVIGKLIAKYNNIIKAIGVGVPAVVYNGTIVGDCGIKEFVNLRLEEKLKEIYQVQIIVENDMNLKAVGFYKKQDYNEDKNIAVINFPQDNCIGSGIIIGGHVIKGNTNFAGEVSYLPFGIFRENLMQRMNNYDDFLPIVVKTITSIIAIINPDTIVLTGDLMKSDMLEDIFKGSLKMIPKEHMPKIIIQKNIYDDYINGLISVTIESLSCDIELVKKRI